MDAVTVIIVLAIVVFASIFGYNARTISHVIVPLRDPIFLTILIGEVILFYALHSALALVITVDGEMALTNSGSTLLMLFAAVDLGYLMGYVMCRPYDLYFFDLPDSSMTNIKVAAFVIYDYQDESCVMPQSLKGVILSLLGARDTIDAPLNEIARRKRYTVDSGGIRRPMIVGGATTVSYYNVDELEDSIFRCGSNDYKDEYGNIVDTQPKYLFHPTVRHYTIRFAQSATDDYRNYILKTDLYKDAINEAVESEARALRLRVQNQEQRYVVASEIVEDLLDMSVDAPGAHEDILARVYEERQRRGDRSLNDEDSR